MVIAGKSDSLEKDSLIGMEGVLAKIRNSSFWCFLASSLVVFNWTPLINEKKLSTETLTEERQPLPLVIVENKYGYRETIPRIDLLEVKAARVGCCLWAVNSTRVVRK